MSVLLPEPGALSTLNLYKALRCGMVATEVLTPSEASGSAKSPPKLAESRCNKPCRPRRWPKNEVKSM